jgi:Fe2+ or Zn2+ uptake regulation protein
VLEAVRESKGHLNASEIWERARALEPRISFATVYNAVHYLCEAGLLLEIPFGDGASLYDARTERHDHAVCTRCGRIADFHSATADAVAAEASMLTGFDATEVRIVLTGLCPDCRNGGAPRSQ